MSLWVINDYITRQFSSIPLRCITNKTFQNQKQEFCIYFSRQTLSFKSTVHKVAVIIELNKKRVWANKSTFPSSNKQKIFKIVPKLIIQTWTWNVQKKARKLWETFCSDWTEVSQIFLAARETFHTFFLYRKYFKFVKCHKSH